MTLDTAFVYREVHRIETKIRQILSNIKHAVALVASFEDEDAEQFIDGVTTWLAHTVMSILAVLRAAKAMTVLASSETPLLV